MTNPTTNLGTTVITLTLPGDTPEHATLAIRCGELDHHATFDSDSFANICRALHAGLKTVISRADELMSTQAPVPAAVDDEPTSDAAGTQNTNSDKTPETEPQPVAICTPASDDTSTDDAPAGKPPYRLQTPDGKHRRMGMLDPFELQERYHKTHKRYIFNDLEEIRRVAQTLVQTGDDTELHIKSSDGQTVQIITAEADDAPGGIHTDTQQKMNAIIGDESRTLSVYRAIQAVRKHDWKNHLVKQREVQQAIFTQISDSGRLDPDTTQIVDALFQVALDSAEFE